MSLPASSPHQAFAPGELDLSAARRLLPPGYVVPPRYQHTATQLTAWGAPSWLVQLGLLIRAIERGSVPPSLVAAELGDDAAEAASALAAIAGGVPRPSLQHVVRIWRLFMLTYRSPAAGVLKIAELLAQLREAEESYISLSLDTIDGAAHICAHLGMWEVRHELRNTAARLSDPHLIAQAASLLERTEPARAALFQELRYHLEGQLAEQKIHARVERRPRALHQIADDGLEGLRGTTPWADAVIVRVDTPSDCYRALGTINLAHRVASARMRDYVGGTKENGYQSIHTTIEYAAQSGDRTLLVDVRIATPEMLRYNQQGFLAYLAGEPVPAGRQLWWLDRSRWLAADAGRSDEIFVFTPKGEAHYLPHQPTVLDFAVRIHSDLGVHCRGALVNGLRASPGEPLGCGDICEVLMGNPGDPIDRRILDLATTPLAKAKIRRALKRDNRGVDRGREVFRKVLARRLEELDIHAAETTIEQQVGEFCRARGYLTVDTFYRAVGRGEAAPDQAVRVIVESLLIPRLDRDAVPVEVRSAAGRMRLATCCWPRPALPAVAVAVHGGRQLTVHSADCPSIRGQSYPLAWRPVEDHAYIADVVYESWDRPGLIHQITGVLQSIGDINVRALDARVPEPSLARVCFSFEAPSRATIDHVRRALGGLPEGRHVEVRAVTLIDEGFRTTTPLDNPYGPQPVGRWPLFVGRGAEVRRIVAQLGSGGVRHILVRGPKRIGKSSLLEHLSRYHLADFNVPATLDLQSLPTEELRFPRLLSRLAEMIAHRAGPRARASGLDPDRAERDPLGAFGDFLEELRAQRDVDPFVVLIDELGVVAARLQGTPLGREFFDQWRALLNTDRVYRHLAFVVALPDVTLAQLEGEAALSEPLRIGELGLPVRLSVLDEDDARDLIAAPVKSHLEYRPEDLDRLLYETGGHPYYTHLVCSQIVTAVQARQRRSGFASRERQVIPSEVVEDALAEVYAHRDAFHHVLADSSPETRAVLQVIAAKTSDGSRYVSLSRLHAWLRRLGLRRSDNGLALALEERPDLLVERDGQVGIRVALVARWLKNHT